MEEILFSEHFAGVVHAKIAFDGLYNKLLKE